MQLRVGEVVGVSQVDGSAEATEDYTITAENTPYTGLIEFPIPTGREFVMRAFFRRLEGSWRYENSRPVKQ